MRFEGTTEINAARDRVWAFLTDPVAVSGCGPDVQRVDVLDAEHFKVVARAGVGPIRATFAFDVHFAELQPPAHGVIKARGQAPGSAVEMTNTLELADQGPERTAVHWTSEVVVSGTIASVGARLVQGAADKITQQVFACIKSKLEASPAATAAPG
jgi:carbon monoxide dehydrogenase subunit G